MIPVFNAHLHQQPVHVHEIDVRTGDEFKPVHHWCCDPNKALCGERLTYAVVLENAEPDPDSCPMCLDVIFSDDECSPGCFDRHEVTR